MDQTKNIKQNFRSSQINTLVHLYAAEHKTDWISTKAIEVTAAVDDHMTCSIKQTKKKLLYNLQTSDRLIDKPQEKKDYINVRQNEPGQLCLDGWNEEQPVPDSYLLTTELLMFIDYVTEGRSSWINPAENRDEAKCSKDDSEVLNCTDKWCPKTWCKSIPESFCGVGVVEYLAMTDSINLTDGKITE